MKKISGFTIIELLVSLTLIAILSLAACPAIYQAIRIYTENVRKTNLAIYSNNIIEYYKLNQNEVKQVYVNKNNLEKGYAEYKFNFIDMDDLKTKLKSVALEGSDIDNKDDSCIFDCFIRINTKTLYKNNLEITLENIKVYEVIVKVSYKKKSNCYIERAGIFFAPA